MELTLHNLQWLMCHKIKQNKTYASNQMVQEITPVLQGRHRSGKVSYG